MKTLIASLTLLVLVISVNAQYGVTTIQCCDKHYPKQLPIKKVVSYITASSRCHLKAHVFTTKANKTFCVNPDHDWVKIIVAKLNVKPTTAQPVM
ncbi:C-C motif chemokine 16-like [Engraulis encrasicolus]|uniref:C-C motif chemokine 16-like n=1 Tax=Engraulis encrasicolus TaxID=184585 RepID=UPI002FD119DA